ncbi:MAG: hypothetical protein FWH06_07320 [Oscillospiraceae bacterium]|nr:hypothetical protein [Oscillospiraceae bacterium]
MPNYDFYLKKYLGNAIGSRAEFKRLAARAAERIGHAERLWTVTYNAGASRDLAICAVADMLLSAEAPAVRSASTGSVSVTYESGRAAPEPQAVREALKLYARVYNGRYQ